MKLLMHVLKANNKLKIDNANIDFDSIYEKLEEEYKEVNLAIAYYLLTPSVGNLKNIVRETFDLVQICILLLWKCYRIGRELGQSDLIKEINIEHKDKLAQREWIIETGIEIDIKE